MTGSSTYLEEKQINYLRGVALPTAPTTIYIGINSADDDAGGSEVTLTYFASRASYTSSNFTAPATSGNFRQILNTLGIGFGNAIATAASIPFFSIWDSLSGGNCLFIGTFTAGGVPTPLSFNTGESVEIDVNGIAVKLSIVAHSIYLRDIELNWFKGTTAPSAPSTYAGIATAAAADGTVAESTLVVRPSGRVLVTPWSAIATAGDYQFSTNTNAIDFGLSAGAVTDVSHIPLWDAASSGNLLTFPALLVPRNVAIGDPVKYNAGRFRLQQR